MPPPPSISTSTSKLPWQMLAIDLDSTLIGRDHTVSARDADALARARVAGIHVALATGRNSTESAGVIGALDLAGLGVFTNGATVCDMATGYHLDCVYLAPALIPELIATFGTLGHAVLVLADPPPPAPRLPYYLLTQHGNPHRATVNWLAANRMHASALPEIPAELLPRILRLGVVVDVPDSPAIEALLTDRFGSQITHHSIYSKHYDCQVIETFAPHVNKWTGILGVCRRMHLDPARVITIGDDTNDIPMLENATLSFAVANAPESIRARAKRITAAQENAGVAQVIDSLLAGEF